MKKRAALSIILIVCLLFISCAAKRDMSTPAPMQSNEMRFSGDNGIMLEKDKAIHNTESYSQIVENNYKDTINDPLSTFSIDVDTASYSNMRRFLMDGGKPPVDAIRIEELINYFSYEYEAPTDETPFAVHTEVAKCPWNTKHNLVMVGLKGKELKQENVKPSNIVFLLDVSGSMLDENKLPLLKSGMKLLVNELDADDKVSIVVYAGAAGVVLEPTSCDNKTEILNAIAELEAGGSTNGAEGIEAAYRLAKESFIEGGNNRVILGTDGDFNVGISSESELVRLIERKRNEGIFLSVLGFGTGNLKDSMMEKLADKGNGNYAYIDSILEAKKVLVEEMGSTLYTIAKDVKIQVEFNPANVKGYRLIGYENRVMNNEDFNDDKKDAGELGAGHEVTAFYEIIPADSDEKVGNVDPLKYQQAKSSNNTTDIMTVKLRYKEPEGNESKLLETIIKQSDITDSPSRDFLFAASVAEFGMIARESQYKGDATLDHAISTAKQSRGADEGGYRNEFIKLMELYMGLQ